MDNILDLWNQFGASHPIYSHLAAILVGGFILPKLINWFDGVGLPRLVNWSDSRQEAFLQRAGFSPDQIKAIRLHEVADLRKSADELETRINSGQ